MTTTVEQIEEDVRDAAAPGFRGRLLARGQARSMIWRDGVLPPGAPTFSEFLSYDLHSYGYSLLGLGLRLRELGGDPAVARTAFEQAASALESVIAKGDRSDTARDFHHVMAAAAYHLGRFSARAYSLLVRVQNDENFSPVEVALRYLMVRNLDDLERLVLGGRLSVGAQDNAIRGYFEDAWSQSADAGPPVDGDGESILLDGTDWAITDNFFAGIAVFLLALERGEGVLVDRAIEILRTGLAACAELNLVPQWWGHRIAIHLLRDLWDASFHENLPIAPDDGEVGDWQQLRRRYLAVLLRRAKAEIDLWPSQIEGASRAARQSDDLVVSLPTSAGKTRIAELCILRCLANGKRVVFVTPLRALSAQTERDLQKTFSPLGKTVSALYGSIGVSGFDVDALRDRDIVVATPEKLDFAIRNDPGLLDDVGLVVLDEGHMIGLGEREVRYEVQIQRLLKRSDANQRRIVCLSAILPDGDQLEDFASWLRRDQDGELIRYDWRPTRLRYGEVVWRNNEAWLNLRVGDERPFVPRFLLGRVPPVGKRAKPFPKDLGELCVASAWRLVEEGQSVLIYCPVRSHVEPFAKRIMDLHRRRALPSLLDADPVRLDTALVLGEEWLGEDHPILQCLKIGVAIHHGALPSAFRKEIEQLLREGVLKVTVSSPTLAQGLNLSATAVIIHSLFRNRQRIKSSEFKNVVGRAGRAYVDVEGLVLYPIFDRHAKRLSDWEALIEGRGSREMESGLVRLVISLILRMQRKLGRPPLDELIEYVMNNAETWVFPELSQEKPEQREVERARWDIFLARLDTAILSLLGDQDIDDDEIAEKLDEILSSSLWERRLGRREEAARNAIKAGLLSRAKLVWADSTARQRRGYFLAGVGLNAGHALDRIAPQANELLVRANAAVLEKDENGAIAAITGLAELAFEIAPFVPDPLPDNWRDMLALWLRGERLADPISGREAEGLQFVERGLIYRLPWAMEAIRVRGIAHGDEIDDGLTLEDVELGAAVAAVESGTLIRAAALLMQAGFTSRLAAIKAVRETGASFENGAQLRHWLDSDEVSALSGRDDWPTPETAEMWRSFLTNFRPHEQALWSEEDYVVPVDWQDGAPPAGRPVRVCEHPVTAEPVVLSETSELLGHLDGPLNADRRGLLLTSVLADRTGVDLTYIGPADLWTQ